MESAMMVADSTQHSCGNSGGSSNVGIKVSPSRTSVRSLSAPTTPSIRGRGCNNDDNDDENIARKNTTATRRVTFPVAEVTGVVEPPNPWDKAVDVTSADVVIAYVDACDRYHVKPLGKVIQQLQKIENFGKSRVSCLDLGGGELDAGQCEALEEIFKRMQFHTINLEDASLSEEGATALFDMIEYYESVQRLVISRAKNFSLRGWQGFCRMIKNTRCLGELDMTGIMIGDNINIVARTLKMCSNLATLYLENCNLSGKYVSILLNCLALNNSLRELYLANNRLSSTDAVQIGSYLRKNSRLKLLHLGNNQLEDNGVSHIVDGLSDQSAGVCHHGLSTLILRNNHLSNKSTRHIAQLLCDCHSLTTLDIGQNNLNNEFVHLVKDPLIRNYSLTSLCLRGCRITCVGAVALAEYIADSSNIQVLDLRDNNIKIGGLMALTHSMEVNSSMTKLELDGVSLKVQLEDPEHHHQNLLFEIARYCERNLENNQKKRADEEANNSSPSKDEVLSEPVTRLLSLWSNQPVRKTMRSQSVASPPPITISSVVEMPNEDQQASSETSGWQMVRGTSHFLRSPQPSPTCSPIPSPTKNRFRVTRVFQEADKNTTVIANSLQTDCHSSGGRFSGRFNKFTVTPVRTIDGVDALIPSYPVPSNKLVQRKSDSDLLSSMSSPKSVDSGYELGCNSPVEVQRLLDTAKDAADEELSGLSSGTSEEEGEDSVFLDVPAVGPNNRVRHDSMRVHRRRLSNSDDLNNKLVLEPLNCDSTNIGDCDNEVSPSGDKLVPEKFGLQNAVDSLEISTLKAGYLKELLESSRESRTSDDVQTTSPSLAEEDDDDDPSSGGDRDSGIYVFDNTADDLSTSRKEQSEKQTTTTTTTKGSEPCCHAESIEEVYEPEEVESVGDITPSSETIMLPLGVSFSLVDIGENDYLNMVTEHDYTNGWMLTTTSEDCKVHTIHKENQMMRCSSSNSLMDLLTGNDDWECSPIVTSHQCDESGDLMLFIEKDSQIETDDCNVEVTNVEQTNSNSNSGNEVTKVVSAWFSRNAATNEWSASGSGSDGDHSKPSSSKTMDTLLQRISSGQCGSDSSNSSDSGVPESPMSCSPPVVDPATSKRKAAVLTANNVGLGLERLNQKSSISMSPGQVIQSRGLMDMAAEFLMSREGISGAMDSRREATSGCLGLGQLSSTVGLGIANEASTTTT